MTMKTLLIEIRMLIAEKLLGWAFSIAPIDTKDGDRLKLSIYQYFDSVVRHKTKAGL